MGNDIQDARQAWRPQGGRVKAIAFTIAQRSSLLPDLPTITESGFPGFESTAWSGMVLPAATPPHIVNRVSTDIERALAVPALRERMLARGGVPDALTPQEFAAFTQAEIAKWTDVAKAANIRIEP